MLLASLPRRRHFTLLTIRCWKNGALQDSTGEKALRSLVWTSLRFLQASFHVLSPLLSLCFMSCLCSKPSHVDDQSPPNGSQELGVVLGTSNTALKKNKVNDFYSPPLSSRVVAGEGPQDLSSRGLPILLLKQTP